MRHRLAAFVVATGLCASGAVACGGGEGPTATGHSSPSGPATSTGPSASTGTSHSSSAGRPKRPVMPPMARQKSVVGAKAFVRYYVAVMNFAWIAKSGRGIRQASSTGCAVCRRLANYVDQTYRSGGWQHGGNWTVRNVGIIPGQPKTIPKLAALVHVSAGHWRKTNDSKVIAIHPRDLTYTITLRWLENQWQTADIVR